MIKYLTYSNIRKYNVQSLYRGNMVQKRWIYLSMALQPLWTMAAFSVSYSYRHLVGLLGRGISPSQGHHLHTEHPCLECDSNPRSQCSRERSQLNVPDREVAVIGRCIYIRTNTVTTWTANESEVALYHTFIWGPFIPVRKWSVFWYALAHST
jgi:hypothetical protein